MCVGCVFLFFSKTSLTLMISQEFRDQWNLRKKNIIISNILKKQI